jgi:DNA-binding MarR family transcriptional regulator
VTRRTPVLPAPEAAPDLEATRLYVALGRLVRSLRREGGGLPISQGVFSALVTVVKEGPLRAGELAAREGVAPPSMTKVVAALEQQALVERLPDPDDGRAALISATAAGRELVDSSRAQRMHGLARRLEALDPDQLAALEAALPVLETLAED